MEISGSILGIKNKSKECIKNFIDSGVDYVHLDVMDGIFVSNTSLPYQEVSNIISNFKYDVHLMVSDVKSYIDEFKNINPEYITFHVETDNVLENINYLKSLNIKVGLSIKPNTKIDDLIPFLSMIDLVLVMSVEPGMGGQQFIPNTLNTVDYLYSYRQKFNLNYKIEIDGGINDKNISKLDKCDIVVVGSFITNGDYKKQVEVLKSLN